MKDFFKTFIICFLIISAIVTPKLILTIAAALVSLAIVIVLIVVAVTGKALSTITNSIFGVFKKK